MNLCSLAKGASAMNCKHFLKEIEIERNRPLASAAYPSEPRWTEENALLNSILAVGKVSFFQDHR
jgi:hypothetical protein